MECTLFGAVDGRVVMAVVSDVTAERCRYLKITRGWTWGDFMNELCRRSGPGEVLNDSSVNRLLDRLEEETPDIIIMDEG